MRRIVVLVAVVASIALGGCFHHSQQVYTEMPPTSVK
jgi:outer membrane lipoprotein SlyB